MFDGRLDTVALRSNLVRLERLSNSLQGIDSGIAKRQKQIELAKRIAVVALVAIASIAVIVGLTAATGGIGLGAAYLALLAAPGTKAILLALALIGSVGLAIAYGIYHEAKREIIDFEIQTIQSDLERSIQRAGPRI